MGFTSDEINAALASKGLRGCPMCGGTDFASVEGVISLSVSPNLQTLQIGGPSVPAVAIGCGNCGFLSLHSANALGLS